MTPSATDIGATDGAELLTVDVWDTLLRRRCHPDCVKLHTAKYLLLRCHRLLPPETRDPFRLLGLRQRAEKELGDEALATGLDDEYRHTDVYVRWLALAGIASMLDDAHRSDVCQDLERIELAQERYVSYGDPAIHAVLQTCTAKTRWFLSDFYLPATAVWDLLQTHGRADGLNGGLVSCDHGINKRSGRLFRDLHQRLDVTAGKHIHIGDSMVSDIQAAQRLGIRAIHYQPEEEHRHRQRREQAFHRRAAALATAYRESIDLPNVPAGAREDAYRFGRTCAPLFVGFALDVMERAVAEDVRQILFFTREGEFFLAVHRELAQREVLGFPTPPADLLEVSRIATFAGSLRNFSVDEFMRIWNQYSIQSLDAFLVTLGAEPASFAAAARRHDIDPAEAIRFPWQDPRFLKFLDDQDVRRLLTEHLAARKRELLAYLETKGLTDRPQSVAVVDIGWRGTIHDNLAYTLPSVRWHGHYLALNRFLNAQPDNAPKAAFGPNLNLTSEWARLLDFVAPMEMLCNSASGSVTGYRIADQVSAERRIEADENAIFTDYTRHFQDGVLSVLPYWADFVRTHAYSAAELKPLALDLWSDIIERPPAFLAEAYFRLSHNETFGVGGFADKKEMPRLTSILLAPFVATRRAEVRKFLTEIGWHQGMFARADLSIGYRWALRALLFGIRLRGTLRESIRKLR